MFIYICIYIRNHYLTSKHGTEVVTAGSQDDAMSWEICALHSQGDVAEGVALAKWVHCVEDGLGVGIGHDVLRCHAALRSSQGCQSTQGVWNREASLLWHGRNNIWSTLISSSVHRLCVWRSTKRLGRPIDPWPGLFDKNYINIYTLGRKKE